MTIGTNRDIENSMKDYLPPFYRELAEAMAVITTEAAEFEMFEENLKATLKQFYVDEADEWGIELWEKVYNIDEEPTQTMNYRRGKIKTKMRGIGTMTPARVKNVADAFHISRVDEYPSEYRIVITIVGTRGEPTNLAIMQQAINEVIPSHLGLQIILTYLVWSEMTTKPDGSGRTWNEVVIKPDLTIRTWDELETTFFN